MNKLAPWLSRFAVLGLATVFVAELCFTLAWRMQHDTPLLHFVAFLINRYHYVPYRDVFETSMPGSILFHVFVGKLFGYNDLAFRIIDTAFLLTLMLVSWLVLRRFGASVALLAVLLFGLFYLSMGPEMSLQRDYLTLLPLALSLLIAEPSTADWQLKSLAIGALFGVITLIKPQLAIGLPIVLAYQAYDPTAAKPTRIREVLSRLLRRTGLAALSYTVILALTLAWLWQSAALASFGDMIFGYLPLHLQLDGDHRVLSSAERPPYLFLSWLRHVVKIAPFLLLGLYSAWTNVRQDHRQRSLILALGSLAAAYSIAPIFAGQFWNYHWMPFDYFAVLSAALTTCFLSDRAVTTGFRPIVALVAMLFLTGFVLVKALPFFGDQLAGRKPPAPNGGRVEEIAQFLKSKKLGADDRVQPLDWTGGAVHAMLIAEARPATRFIYNYHFYHHISRPYIQHLRKELMDGLTANPPRLIIEVDASPRPTGIDTTTEFPELSSFIASTYRAAKRGDGYTVFERIEGSSTPKSATQTFRKN